MMKHMKDAVEINVVKNMESTNNESTNNEINHTSKNDNNSMDYNESSFGFNTIFGKSETETDNLPPVFNRNSASEPAPEPAAEPAPESAPGPAP